MKKILTIMLLIIATTVFAGLNDYQLKESSYKSFTIGEYNSTEKESNSYVIVATSDTLAYADTNEHAFTLDSGDAYYTVEFYSSYVVEIKITYRGNPNDVNFIIGTASTSQTLSGANAIALLDSDYWVTKTIDLNTSGGTGSYYYLLPDCLLNSSKIYFKYSYSGDPSNDIMVEIYINRV